MSDVFSCFCLATNVKGVTTDLLCVLYYKSLPIANAVLDKIKIGHHSEHFKLFILEERDIDFPMIT